jgi:hypothetical protein
VGGTQLAITDTRNPVEPQSPRFIFPATALGLCVCPALILCLEKDHGCPGICIHQQAARTAPCPTSITIFWPVTQPYLYPPFCLAHHFHYRLLCCHQIWLHQDEEGWWGIKWWGCGQQWGKWPSATTAASSHGLLTYLQPAEVQEPLFVYAFTEPTQPISPSFHQMPRVCVQQRWLTQPFL